MLSSFVRMVGQQLLPDTFLGICFHMCLPLVSDPEVCLGSASQLQMVLDSKRWLKTCVLKQGQLAQLYWKLSNLSKRMHFFFPRSVMESLQDQESSLPVKRRRLQGLKERKTPFFKGKIQSQRHGGIHNFETVLWHYEECQHVKILEICFTGDM